METEQTNACRLCGLPVRGRKDGFCCLGCSHVFEILKEIRSRGFDIYLLSNGILIDKERAKILSINRPRL